MMTTRNGDAPSDAELTAYLDGELDPTGRAEVAGWIVGDPEVMSRLEQLRRGGDTAREGLDLLLDAAPHGRLKAILSSADFRTRPPPGVQARRPLRWGALAVAASVLLMISGASGFLLGQSPPAFLTRMFEWDQWQESVARQMSLYNRESLAAIDVDTADQQSRLSRLGQRLGVDLSASAVTLPNLVLKRVDLLQINQRPLLQLVYDGDQTGPVALCIVAEPGDDDERRSRRIAGMNLVYWSTRGHGFLLVGSAPANSIEAIAEIVSRRFLG